MAKREVTKSGEPLLHPGTSPQARGAIGLFLLRAPGGLVTLFLDPRHLLLPFLESSS